MMSTPVEGKFSPPRMVMLLSLGSAGADIGGKRTRLAGFSPMTKEDFAKVRGHPPPIVNVALRTQAATGETTLQVNSASFTEDVWTLHIAGTRSAATVVLKT